MERLRSHPEDLPSGKKGELSFTLLETVIAISLITTVMMQVLGAQGNIVYFSGYSRNVTQGIWLAKRIMAQVEYHASTQELKELETDEKDKVFEDPTVDPRFKYNLSIKEWKFPVLDLLAGGSPGGEEEGEDSSESKKESSDGDPMVKDLMKQIFGDHIIKIAHVEVTWPEGAKQNSVTLTYLLANQRKLDEKLLTMKASAEALTRASAGGPKNNNPGGQGAQGQGAQGQGQGAQGQGAQGQGGNPNGESTP